MAAGRWRTCLGALFVLSVQIVNCYEQTYTISQLSPKSVVDDRFSADVLLKTSDADLAFNLEPSAKYDDIELIPEDIISDRETESHVIVERSVEPSRGSRSINIDEIPSTNNNEIDNGIELHNRRKYYDIDPTKTVDYYTTDEVMLMSSGFGDKLDFKFPGEGKRAPKGRALAPPGPKIWPTAVQPPTFATTSLRDQGRQNSEIHNIITGIVQMLNGKVNVQANTQLLNGRPRPMTSRINNRGPPRITESYSAPEFDKPNTPPPLFHPTKIPPPYPFDIPHGVNLPEQIVPPLNNRPGFHRPLPPWQRPRPRPPSRRPNPGLPVYKPTIIPPPDIPDLDDKQEENVLHSENNIHSDDIIPSVASETTTEIRNVTEDDKDIQLTTAETTSTSTSTTETVTDSTTTSTTTTTTSTTEKPIELTTQKTTTEKAKTEKPVKPEKKKEQFISDKNRDKYKLVEEKTTERPLKINIDVQPVIESSISEVPPSTTASVASPTPTIGLISHAPTVTEAANVHVEMKTSSINTEPLPTSEIPYQPYRPRPGIVLDDTDFKPHGTRYRPDAPIITAAETALPGYGEIFDVTVSAIQGPGEKPASVHVEHINVHRDDIIISSSGEHGFVSIDGKKTYLNLFDTSTPTIAPTRVQSTPYRTGPPPTLGPTMGTGVAIPADDVPLPPRRPHTPHRQPPYRRPQPTVRIDTCIVGDDSTCDQAQNEMCRTEAGISSCQCRPGYARRIHRDPCRRVVSLVLNLRVDRIYDRKMAWDAKLADKESEPYQQLSFEAVRAIDSAFSMTPFSDDFVSGSVNSVYNGDEENRGIFVNYTVLMQETAETLRPSVATDIQKHLLGVVRRRSNNIGASALWVDSPAACVLPLHDLDECSSPDLNDCHELAMCTNTWGAFTCQCPDSTLDAGARAGRLCRACGARHCSERGECRYARGQPYCTCSSGYYGSTCEMDGEVIGVAVGASLVALLVIGITFAALMSWRQRRVRRCSEETPVPGRCECVELCDWCEDNTNNCERLLKEELL